jgi:hypothetical protein
MAHHRCKLTPKRPQRSKRPPFLSLDIGHLGMEVETGRKRRVLRVQHRPDVVSTLPKLTPKSLRMILASNCAVIENQQAFYFCPKTQITHPEELENTVS